MSKQPKPKPKPKKKPSFAAVLAPPQMTKTIEPIKRYKKTLTPMPKKKG